MPHYCTVNQQKVAAIGFSTNLTVTCKFEYKGRTWYHR